MGKSFAPSLANMYLIELDRKAISNYAGHLDLFSRFIDYIFFICLSSIQKLELTYLLTRRTCSGVQTAGRQHQQCTQMGRPYCCYYL